MNEKNKNAISNICNKKVIYTKISIKNVTSDQSEYSI